VFGRSVPCACETATVPDQRRFPAHDEAITQPSRREGTAGTEGSLATAHVCARADSSDCGACPEAGRQRSVPPSRRAAFRRTALRMRRRPRGRSRRRPRTPRRRAHPPSHARLNLCRSRTSTVPGREASKARCPHLAVDHLTHVAEFCPVRGRVHNQEIAKRRRLCAA